MNLNLQNIKNNANQIISDFETDDVIEAGLISTAITGGGAVAVKGIALNTGTMNVPVIGTALKTLGGFALTGLKVLGTASIYAVGAGVGAVTGIKISEKLKALNPELAQKLAIETADKWLSEKLGLEYAENSVPVIIDTETNKTYVPEQVIKQYVNMFYNERLYEDVGGFDPYTTLTQGTVLDKSNLGFNLNDVISDFDEQYKVGFARLALTVQNYLKEGDYVLFDKRNDSDNYSITIYRSDTGKITVNDVFNYSPKLYGGVSSIWFNTIEPLTEISFFLLYDGSVEIGEPVTRTEIRSMTAYQNTVYTADNHGITLTKTNGVDRIGRLPNIQVPSAYDVFEDYLWEGHINKNGLNWYPLVLGQTATQSNAKTGDLSDTDVDIIDDSLVNVKVAIDAIEGTTPTYPPTIDVIIPPNEFIPTQTINNGMVGCFNLTNQEAIDFSKFLWSDGFVNTLINLISDPINTVISFHQIYATPTLSDEKVPIKCGYVTSTVEAFKVNNQYITIDCGTIEIKETHNSYSDYEPYTKVEIFLPFIGMNRLNANDVMGRSINVIYNIDVYTGTCVANIYVNGGLLYSYSGNCSIQIPLTGGSFAESIIGLVGGAVGGAVSGAVSGGVGGAIVGGLTGSFSNITNMFEVTRTGNMSANAGIFTPRKPYLIISRTQDVTPTNYQVFEGFASSNFVLLGTLSGFSRVIDVDINNIICTNGEKELIENALNEGVIF